PAKPEPRAGLAHQVLHPRPRRHRRAGDRDRRPRRACHHRGAAGYLRLPARAQDLPQRPPRRPRHRGGGAMKRLFIAALLTLLLAAALAAAIQYDPGYVLIAFGGYTLETTVWVGLGLFLLILLAMYLL